MSLQMSSLNFIWTIEHELYMIVELCGTEHGSSGVGTESEVDVRTPLRYTLDTIANTILEVNQRNVVFFQN